MAKWTADDWDQSESASLMLQAISTKGPELDRRKLRLFCVALCRRFRDWVTDDRCHAALAAAESDAEQALTSPKLDAARGMAEAALEDWNESSPISGGRL